MHHLLRSDSHQVHVGLEVEAQGVFFLQQFKGVKWAHHYAGPNVTWTQRRQSTTWHLPKEEQSNPDRVHLKQTNKKRKLKKKKKKQVYF